MDFVVYIMVLVHILTHGVECSQITSQDKTIRVRKGSTKILNCEIDADLGTVVNGGFEWRKIQDYENPEAQWTTLNSAGAIKTTLDDEWKLHLDATLQYSGNEPPVDLQLTLKNIRTEESGRYECHTSIGGNVVDKVTYNVQVLDEIDEVLMYAVNDGSVVPDNPNTTNWAHMDSISFGDQKPGYLACIARGAYPYPTLQVTVGDRSITGHLTINEPSYTLMGDKVNQQNYYTTRLLATKAYMVDLEEDGAQIKCTALIQDEASQEFSKMEAKSTLSLQAKPSFSNCSSLVKAPLDTKNYQITCEFTAKPTANMIRWTARTTGDVVKRKDGPVNDYTASMGNLEGNHRYLATLTIGTVDYDDYQVYQLTVGNAEGDNSHEVELQEGEDIGGSTQGCSAVVASMSLLLLTVITSVFS